VEDFVTSYAQYLLCRQTESNSFVKRLASAYYDLVDCGYIESRAIEEAFAGNASAQELPCCPTLRAGTH